MPVRRGGIGVDGDAGGIEMRIGRRQGRPGPGWRQRSDGNVSAVRSKEGRVPVGAQVNGVSLFVHRPVVTSAQQHQVVEPGGATIGPVANVVRVAAPRLAAGVSRQKRIMANVFGAAWTHRTADAMGVSPPSHKRAMTRLRDMAYVRRC